MMSMMQRKSSMEYAASRWLMPVAVIQNYRANRQVLEIRYEDLVLKSHQTLKTICGFLGVDFNMDYFVSSAHQSKGIIKKNQWKSWNLDPQLGISDQSIGKYKESTIDFRPVLSMRLTKEYAHLIRTGEHSLVSLARSYNYALPGDDSGESKGRLVPFQHADTIKKHVGNCIRNRLVEYERASPGAVY